MSSAAPWMPLYVADYLADTAHLSAAEHGAYLLLIMHYWRTGKLPNDERQIARIARMNAREWDRSRETIAAFFDAGWRPIQENFVFRGRVTPPNWQALRLTVFARDGHACVYCGSIGPLECDHLYPVSRGGSDDLTNLVTACQPCNRSKKDKTVEEWLQ